MMAKRAIRSLINAAGAFTIFLALSPATALAQNFWDTIFNDSAAGFGSRGQMEINKKYAVGTIIVSFADKRLYHVRRPGHAATYPVAIPTDDARWSGRSHVSMKKINPSWTPTASMLRENPKLPSFVPGGHPRNPLGTRALYLGKSLYRIHGTDAPWTIGTAVSHGCIRMYNEDVLELFESVKIGALVIVTWEEIRRSS